MIFKRSAAHGKHLVCTYLDLPNALCVEPSSTLTYSRRPHDFPRGCIITATPIQPLSSKCMWTNEVRLEPVPQFIDRSPCLQYSRELSPRRGVCCRPGSTFPRRSGDRIEWTKANPRIYKVHAPAMRALCNKIYAADWSELRVHTTANLRAGRQGSLAFWFSSNTGGKCGPETSSGSIR